MDVIQPIDSLRGIGHFTIWYLVGFCVFLILKRKAKFRHHHQSRTAMIYGPFLPFVLGGFGALPYLFEVIRVITPHDALSPLFNIFLFYGVLSQSTLLSLMLSSFELNIAFMGLAYLYILAHYISLVKKVRARYAK